MGVDDRLTFRPQARNYWRQFRYRADLSVDLFAMRCKVLHLRSAFRLGDTHRYASNIQYRDAFLVPDRQPEMSLIICKLLLTEGKESMHPQGIKPCNTT